MTASIEFDSKEDVLAAQTKDMKTFDGNAIEVKVGSGSTLYVCNFPPTADEVWIRDRFEKVGSSSLGVTSMVADPFLVRRDNRHPVPITQIQHTQALLLCAIQIIRRCSGCY